MTAPGRPRTEIDWETIERVADQAERSHLEALSPEELEAELRAGGVDPGEADRLVQKALADTADPETSDDSALLRIVGGATATKPRASSSLRIVALKGSAWVVATAAAAGFMVQWFTRSPGEGAAPGPDAAQLRGQAAEACRRESWAECEAKLDKARAVDPSGESEPRVVEERKAIAAHRR